MASTKSLFSFIFPAMEHLIEFGLFFAKTLVIVLSLFALIAFIAAQTMKGSQQDHPGLEVDDFRKRISDYAELLNSQILDKKVLKKLEKEKKKQEKEKADPDKRIFVIDFDGDVKATSVKNLRDEVSLLLKVANPAKDQALVRVNSPGGMVHTYGLAAAQLDRIRKAGMHLTVAVDKVAASGGYLMACTADKIISSPFAILGSIGVVAQVPNFHRLLKEHNVDYEEMTAGDYKRTVSIFGEITEKGRKKFVEQLEETHFLFKDFVAKHRPQLDIDKVSTGEYWFGYRAKELNLVDEVLTSDEYIYGQPNNVEIIKIGLVEKKKLGEKLGFSIAKITSQITDKVIDRLFEINRFGL